MYTGFRVCLACVLVVLSVVWATAAPLGNGFTYQGKLTDSNGVPVSGSYSMSFRLYDDATVGTQVGNTVGQEAVSVVGGLFTVQLDFGAGAFSGQKRWLETRIGTQILSPRTEITSAPTAVYAQTVPWSGVTGAPVIPTTLPPSGVAGGSLAGTYPNPVIADGAVSTTKIADGAVTAAKIAPGALGSYSGSIQNLAGVNANPVVVGTVTTASRPNFVAVSGNYAYVANWAAATMQVIDISNPASPSVVGSVNTGTNCYWVTVSGNYAYVASVSASSLQIIDISNPTNPVVVGSAAAGNISSVAVSGRYAYVTEYPNGLLKVVDVSNPAAPVVVSSVVIGTQPKSISIWGKYATAICSNSNTIQIFDVSNPASPGAVGTLTTIGYPRAIVISGGYAYVTTYSDQLEVYDISDPSGIVRMSVVGQVGSAEGLAISGRYAYLVSSGAMRVVDVGDPARAVLVGSVAIANGGISCAVSGRYAYVASSLSNSLQVVDVAGIETTALSAHSLEAGTLEVQGSAKVAGQLSVGGGLNVGKGGIFSDGDITTGGQVKASTFRLGASATAGQVLKTDANGVGTWQNDSVSLPFSGTSSSGTAFSIDNKSVSGYGLLITNSNTSGYSSALDVYASGTGCGGYFTIGNSNSSATAVTGFNYGTGTAGYFNNSATTNYQAAVFARTSGTGPALKATGTYAGEFNGRVYMKDKLGIGVGSPDDALCVVGGLKLDQGDSNNGDFTSGAIKFGAGNSGEGIASKRTANGNWAGLDFYTGYSNRMTIQNGGNVGIGTITPSQKLDVNGAIRCNSLTQTSDARFKTNISTISNALDSTLKLRGVMFDWNRGSFEDRQFPEGRQIGVIAQEVEKVFPELVSKDSNGYESVSYDKLVPVLIEAVKTLKADADTKDARINELEARLSRLEKLIGEQNNAN